MSTRPAMRARGVLSLGTVLRQSGGIVRRHLPVLVVFAAVAHGPWMYVYLDRMHEVWTLSPGTDSFLARMDALNTAWMALSYGPVLSGFLLQTAVVQGVYLARTGTRFPFVRGLGRLRRLPVALLVAVLLILAAGGVAVGGSWVVVSASTGRHTILPGVMLLILYLLCLAIVSVWFVAIQASVIEKGGPIRALRRSAFLTRGSRWRLFALLLLLVALGIVGISLASLLTGSAEEGRTWSRDLWRVLLLTIAPILASTFHAVAAAVTYYLLRRGKEGIEIGEATQAFE